MDLRSRGTEGGDDSGRDTPVRSLDVLLAIGDWYGQDPTILRSHPLYVARELVFAGYFAEPPALVYVENAQKVITQMVRQ